jgi:AraC-like DNA-binding protein
MKVYIKNMVCERCNLAVSSLLDEMELKSISVELGQVNFGDQDLPEPVLTDFKLKLEHLGFELLDDKKSRLIDKIKTSIIELVHGEGSLENIKLSAHIKEQINYDYNHISHLFSNTEGMTIEQYFINQKIEKIKELLIYDELSATEIAYRLGYSSLAHLSGQFKKHTGMTPSQFKKLKDVKLRKSLDKT